MMVPQKQIDPTSNISEHTYTLVYIIFTWTVRTYDSATVLTILNDESIE